MQICQACIWLHSNTSEDLTKISCVYFNEVYLLKGSFQLELHKTKPVYIKKAWIYPPGSCNKLIVNFTVTNLVRSLNLLGVQEWNDFILLIRATSCIQSKPLLQLVEYFLNHLLSIFFSFLYFFQLVEDPHFRCLRLCYGHFNTLLKDTCNLGPFSSASPSPHQHKSNVSVWFLVRGWNAGFTFTFSPLHALLGVGGQDERLRRQCLLRYNSLCQMLLESYSST